MRVVIIGGDAAGLKTAARLRRVQPDTEIVVFEKGDTISYAACGLPYFLSGDIDSFDDLIETAWGEKKTPEYFKATKNIDVFIRSEVINIDPDSRAVHLSAEAKCSQKEWSYDALVIATGAKPFIPAEYDWKDLEGVSCFTHPEEAKSLRRDLERNQVGSVAIIGGGYIGLELCEAFGALWGVDSTLVEKEKHVLPGFLDPEMAQLVEKELKSQGVDLHLSTTVSNVSVAEKGLTVTLSDGGSRTVDRVIMAMGVVPNCDLLRNGLSEQVQCGTSGGILIDDQGHTTADAVYSVGDCTELPDIYGTRILPLGSIANRMGRVVANTIAGIDDHFPPVWGTGVVKVFDLNVSCCGKSASVLQKAGIKYEEYWGAFTEKAHYYPEGEDVCLKVTRLAGGHLTGIQAISKGEVVRWVDAFVQVLDLAEGDPSALLRFEHAYAPPYANAMDPLHHIGSMILEQQDMQLSPLFLLSGGDKNWTIVNLLSPDERQHVQLPPQKGTVIEMEWRELRERYTELPKEKVALICARGPRSYEGVLFLRHQGIEARYIAGGISFL